MQQKKSAIVTGASSGIGFSIAKELCNLGYEVYGFGRNFSKAGVASYIETQPLFHAKVCDLLETQRMCDMAKGIAKSTQLHILVNAAGVGYYGLHEELNVKQIQTLVRTNLEVPMILTNRLLRTLKQNRGHIINVSSITAKQNNPHGCAYGAVKAGLTSFGASLFEEARKYGIKVTTIHPDMTDTDLYRDADFTCAKEAGCYLESEQIAEAVRFLLEQPKGTVIPELTIRPQYHRIARKAKNADA